MLCAVLPIEKTTERKISVDKEKLQKQLVDIETEILSDLKNALAEEMGKPLGERDENLVSELETMISQEEEEIVSASKNRSLEAVMKMLDEQKNSKRANHILLYKRLSAAAACVLMLFGLNYASTKTFGQNMFSAGYKLVTGAIVISPERLINDTGISDFTSATDPYGMKAKCAEYGFFPDTPSYIPDGFVLDDILEDSSETSDDVIFYYKKGKIKLNIQFINFKSGTEIPSIGIPTDTYNIVEEEVNGRKTQILNEDSQFTSIFIENRIEHTIFAEGLDYDECYKVLESLS